MSQDDAQTIEDFIRAIPEPQAGAQGGLGLDVGPQEVMHTLLRFRLGAHHYAIPGELIREVIQPNALTRLPGAPTHIRGVVVHRRSVLGVLDLAQWLGVTQPDTEQSAAGRLVVVEHGDLTAGIYTDGLTQIMTITDPELQSAVKKSDAQQNPYIEAVLTAQSEPIMLLRIARILDDAAIRHT